MPFSVVIPTYNRPGALKRCLASIVAQSVLPDEIFMIDDGDLAHDVKERMRVLCEGNGIRFIYYQKDLTKERRGTSESRNRALEFVSNDFLILDDDIRLEPGFSEAVSALWEKKKGEPGLAGIGGVIVNHRRKNVFEKAVLALFGLNSKERWDVNGVAFQVWDDEMEEASKGHYIHGGLCLYRKAVVSELGFTSFGGGRAALEDVDFCLRAKKAGYHFYIEPKAKAFHDHAPGARETEWQVGKKENANRRLIFRAGCPQDAFHRAWFAWASFGWILRQFLAGHLAKGMGMIQGSLRRPE